MEPAARPQFCLKLVFPLKQGLLGSGKLSRRCSVIDLAEEPVSGLSQPLGKFAEGCCILIPSLHTPPEETVRSPRKKTGSIDFNSNLSYYITRIFVVYLLP
jgi:hypothetical protein